MSGVEVGSSWIRKGAVDAILNHLNGCATAAVGADAEPPREVNAIADAIAKSGGTPLAVAKDGSCSASSSSRTSSRAASASALPNCAAWASAP